MKIRFKKALLLVVPVIFLLIQFIRPERNESGIGSNHIISSKELPAEVGDILSVSCFDCHSNQTNYRWYDNIAPASWMVEDHILEGKSEVNFSDWQLMDEFDKISVLSKVSKEVAAKEMPLKSYTFIHKEAKLSDEEIQLLSDWCEKTSIRLLNDPDKEN